MKKVDEEVRRLRKEHDLPTQEEREVLYIELMEKLKELGAGYLETALHQEHPCHTLSKRLLHAPG